MSGCFSSCILLGCHSWQSNKNACIFQSVVLIRMFGQVHNNPVDCSSLGFMNSHCKAQVIWKCISYCCYAFASDQIIGSVRKCMPIMTTEFYFSFHKRDDNFIISNAVDLNVLQLFHSFCWHRFTIKRFFNLNIHWQGSFNIENTSNR